MRRGVNRPKRASQPERQLLRIRLWFLGLLIASFTAAIVISVRYHLGVPETLLTLLIGGGAPAMLYLAWKTFVLTFVQGHPLVGKRKSLAQAAEELAESISTQWANEIDVRQLGDYQYLFVSWTPAADSSLTVKWDKLAEAAREPGQPVPPPRGTWAGGQAELAGRDTQLPEVLKRIPTGWLAVLGEPGSGKTMLMVRLIIDLLAARKKEPRSDAPIPVFVPITSWDPRNQDLYKWLEEQLTLSHPGLAANVSAATPGKPRQSRIAALLSEQKIVPLLDGLDEMPIAMRRAAISKLNETFKLPNRPLQLVVTCRVKEYKEAVGQYGAGWNPLRCAAAIQLQPLDTRQVKEYLSEDNTDPRWNAVVGSLDKPTPVAKALRTPLYVSLAGLIYNPHSDDPDEMKDVPHPSELRSRKLYPTSGAIQEHLLEAFVPAAYRRMKQRAKKAEQWLIFLAGYLNGNEEHKGTGLLWWNIDDLAPRGLVPFVVGVICGIATAIAAVTGTHVGVGIGLGFGTGMLIAIGIGLGFRYLTLFLDRDRYRAIFEENRRPGPGMAGGLAGAAIGAIAAGVAGKLHLGHQLTLFGSMPEALGIGIGSGASTRFAGGLIGGLIGSFVAGTLEGIGLGVPAGIVNGLGVGLAAGLAVKFVGRRKPAGRTPDWRPEIGIPGGIVIGGAIGLLAWREEGVIAGAVAAVVIGVAASWPFGMRHTDQDLRAAPTPGQTLAMDASAFRRTAIAAGLAAACAGFAGSSMASIFEVGRKATLQTIVGDGLGIGLASGVVIGLTFGFYHATSARFLIISWWLALSRKTPLRLRHFLDDAHQRSVLRQVGPAYEFRHALLLEHLAKKAQPQRDQPRTVTTGLTESASTPTQA
jgi:hypothetical protein